MYTTSLHWNKRTIYNPKIHQGQLPNHQSHKHHNKPRISRFFNYIANLSIRERIPQAPFKKLVEIVEETFFQHKPMILMFLGIYSSPKWLSWKEYTYPKCNVPFKWYVAHLIGLTIRLGAHVHNTYHQGWWINKSNINLNLHWREWEPGPPYLEPKILGFKVGSMG